MERLGRRGRTVLFDQRVGPVEMDERDRDGTVLGSSPAGQNVRADGGRQAMRDASRRASSAAAPAATSRLDREARAAAAVPAPWTRPGIGSAGCAAVSGLTMISPASAPCSIATSRLQPGPTGRNSKWDVPTAKKWKQSRMHALRHPQRDLRPGDFDPADVAQHAAHQDGRATGARGVTLALEPHQQRIAAELEQAAAVFVGDEQDRLETAPDRLGDLLGALAALAGEPFGQLREPGDVHEDGAAFRGPASGGRIVDQMLLEDPCHVRNRTFRIGTVVRRNRFVRRNRLVRCCRVLNRACGVCGFVGHGRRRGNDAHVGIGTGLRGPIIRNVALHNTSNRNGCTLIPRVEKATQPSATARRRVQMPATAPAPPRRQSHNS